jgi:zinc protease
MVYLIMKYVRIIIAFLFISIPVTVCGSDIKEYKLKNGLKVIIIEEHKAPVATFQIWYRVGLRNEPAGKSGMSHLLEHMMFKGTSMYGPSVLTKLVQKNGGTDNAHTTKDHTAYFEIVPSDRIMLPVELEADRMKNLILDSKDVLSERSVVMEERRLRYEDDPQSSLFEEVVAAAFKVHPYQRPVIGWMSEIKSIEREDLCSYYKTYYSPGNAVIIIVGDINPDEMMKKVREHFEALPSEPVEKQMPSVEPEQKGERRVTLKREAELPFIILAYHTPNFPDDDNYALDVLALILSGGKSTRLYQSLVYEKKVALSASADYSSFNMDPYLFYFFASAAPGKDIKDLEEALFTEAEKIKKEQPSEREVQKAKNKIEASFIMEQDSIYMQAMKYGMFEMLGDWRLIDKYIEGIRKVTAEDVMNVARKYLKEENRTVGILIPTKKVKSEE